MRLKEFKGFGVAVGASAVVLAGCGSTSSSPAPGPVASLERSDARLETQASAFETFMRNASGIDAGFGSGGEVSRALQVGAAHEPHQLESGMVAYAALAALQEPGFVAGVQKAGRDGGLARQLAVNPNAAMQLPGASAAAGRAGAALLRQGDALTGEGQKVKKAAYSVQHQGWSKAKVPDPAGRLSRVKRLSTITYQPTAGDRAHLQAALSEGGRRSGAASPLVARGVAVAALSVLGQEERGRALMSDARTASCLRMAKLNLYQCLASAGPHYEDVYCLGQHAMIDPGQCVVEAAKGPGPVRRTVVKASYQR